MQVEHRQWTSSTGWNKESALQGAQLVIYFAGREALAALDCYRTLSRDYRHAHIIGCSTGGEIFGSRVAENSIVAAAIQFEQTPLRTASTMVEDTAGSFTAGKYLAEQLIQTDLRYVLVLSDGTHVNGSELIRGLYSVLPASVTVTGGLAGDEADFKTTFVGLDATPISKKIAAIGLYGDALQVGAGSVGGWRPFGQTRTITRSAGNILYELDEKPALDLYKVYLGEDAAYLPGSALLYPFNIRPDANSEHDMVRTIVGIDEAKKAMIFAGDVPEGYMVRLMRGPADQLIAGAARAASMAHPHAAHANGLALLISCIGRKLLLDEATCGETKAIAELLHPMPTIGFYSYGEIGPQENTGACALHNQTMTITVLQEHMPATPSATPR